MTRRSNVTSSTSHCRCDGIALLAESSTSVLLQSTILFNLLTSCTDRLRCHLLRSNRGPFSKPTLKVFIPTAMPSTPDQFCNELNEYTNLTLPCQKQEAEEKEALQQATAQAGSCVQAQDEFTSPKNTPSNHLPAYGRYSPVNAMQHGHALYCRRQTCLSPDGQQQAYPITSSARAHHIQATKPAIHKGQTHQYSQPGHQQHQWLEYTRAALAPTETQEHGSPAALAAQAHPPWIYTQTPTYHDEHDPQARPYDSHFNSRHQTVVSADMPTSSLNLPPFSDPQLAPYFSPNPHGSDPNQHQNTSGHRCQSAITRVHFPALTVTPVPDGPRIHHPSLTYAIERDNTLPRGSRIHHPSFAFVPEFHGDGNASNGPAATDAIQPQSGEHSPPSITAEMHRRGIRHSKSSA